MQMHASDANNNSNNNNNNNNNINIKSNLNINHRPVRQGRATGQRAKNKFSFSFSFFGAKRRGRTLTEKSLLALRALLWYPIGNILCVCEEKYHEKEEFPLP